MNIIANKCSFDRDNTLRFKEIHAHSINNSKSIMHYIISMEKYICFLISLTLAGKMIEYKFRQNYGQIYYDYSGNGRHGVSGTSTLASTQDTSATDRGAYFDSSAYMTLPLNSVCPTAFTIPASFSILFWLYPKNDNFLLFERFSSSSGFFFKIQRNSGNSIKGQVCVNSLNSGLLVGSPNSFETSIWQLISLVSDGANFFYARNNVISLTISLGNSYSELGIYTTTIGDSSSGPIMFLWYFALFDTNINPGDFVSTAVSSTCLTISGSCSCSSNMCDTKFVDPDLGAGSMTSEGDQTKDALGNSCNPNFPGCSEKISLSCQCSSYACVYSGSANTCQCIDLANGALTNAVCTCVSGFSNAAGSCCSSQCSSCGSNPDICTACKTNHAIPDATGCKCNVGYYATAALTSASACTSCYSECATCSSFGPCLTCLATYAAPNTGGNGCICNNGYQGSHPLVTAGACYTCYAECLTCSSPTICLTCVATLSSPNAVLGCTCSVGTYAASLTLITPGACVVCDSECSACTEALKCTGCKATLAVIDSVQGCNCIDGTYAAISPQNSANACVTCYQECSKCTQSQSCTECKTTFAVPNAGVGCKCIDGTYAATALLILANSCVQCYQECSLCLQPLQCTACIALYATPDATQTCKCIPGYYASTALLTASDSCKICYQECSQCVESFKCTQCKTAHAEIDSIQGCKCSLGYFALVTPLILPLDCEECFFECSSCNSISQCLTCKDQNAVPDPVKGCICKPGFYKDSLGSCIRCNIECKTCFSQYSCSACQSSNTIISLNSYCECTAGYYNISKSPTLCERCPIDCKTCINASRCLTCKTENANPTDQGTCICPDSSSVIGNSCQCNDGFYIDWDLSTKVCRPCNSTCRTCYNSTACETCSVRKKIDPISKFCVLVCRSNQVIINDKCTDCPSLCDICNKTLYCSQCSKNANKIGLACKCNPGYTNIDNHCTLQFFWAKLTVGENNRLQLEFSVSPSLPLTFNDFSVELGSQASYSIKFVQKSISIYLFIVSFTENIGAGIQISIRVLMNPLYAIDNSQLGNYSVQGQLNEYIY